MQHFQVKVGSGLMDLGMRLTKEFGPGYRGGRFGAAAGLAGIALTVAGMRLIGGASIGAATSEAIRATAKVA